MIELLRSKSQYRYVLVIQDLFTTWLELKPLRKAGGNAVARALEELIFFRWKTPEYLLTNNGTEFVNQALTKTLDEYGIQHATTPPYHPQANPVERSNRTLKTMIATFVYGNHRNWDAHLHEFRHAINTAMKTSLKTPPAFLNYSRHSRPVKSLRRELEKKEPVLRLGPGVWKDRVTRLDALKVSGAVHRRESHQAPRVLQPREKIRRVCCRR